MGEWTTVAQIDDLQPGTGIEVVASGLVLALFNVGGTIYAIDGVCPHAGGPLGAGTLDDCVVTCPWHGWQFDVTSGQHTLNPTLSHTTYPARVSQTAVQVLLPSAGVN